MSAEMESDWTIVFLDGTKEKVYGKLTVSEGVVWVTDRSQYGPYIKSQVAYPLSSLKSWVREE